MDWTMQKIFFVVWEYFATCVVRKMSKTIGILKTVSCRLKWMNIWNGSTWTQGWTVLCISLIRSVLNNSVLGMYEMIGSATRCMEYVEHRLTDHFGFSSWNPFFFIIHWISKSDTIKTKAAVLCSKSELYNYRYLRSNSVV